MRRQNPAIAALLFALILTTLALGAWRFVPGSSTAGGDCLYNHSAHGRADSRAPTDGHNHSYGRSNRYPAPHRDAIPHADAPDDHAGRRA